MTAVAAREAICKNVVPSVLRWTTMPVALVALLVHARFTNVADAAVALSPLDPLYYGMLSVRAFSHIVTGDTEKAAACRKEAEADYAAGH